jgi:hypothetical protein
MITSMAGVWTPIFAFAEIILVAIRYFGLIIVDLVEGDYIYFPSNWFHEVHNLSTESMALAGSIFNFFYASNLCLKEEKDHSVLSMTVNALIGLQGTFEDLVNKLGITH